MAHYSAIAMKNVMLTVTTVISEPYTMLKESANQRLGNEQFEGFCVDLIGELSNIMGFRYKFKLVSDGAYGIKDENGEWNGMIGEPLLTCDLSFLISFSCDLRRTDPRRGRHRYC